MKNSIGKFMTAKLSYILRSNTAQEAALKMEQDNSSALVVLDSNEKPVGVVTHRDLVRSSCVEDVPCDRILVRDIMSTPIVTIDPYSPVETAADVMKQNNVRHLLVVDSDRPNEPLGILGSRDFALYIENEHLEEK
jgi:CBS domain-containing protein